LPAEGLPGDPELLAELDTFVSGLPIEAIASRTFAGVIVNGRPPVRPRERAEAMPAIVRGNRHHHRTGRI
jgi:hypothetical protein